MSKQESTVAFWDRLQKKLDKHKRKWTQKRNKEAQKFVRERNCGGTDR